MIKTFILSALSVAAAVYLLSAGVHVAGNDNLSFITNIAIVTLVLTLVNLLIKPIIMIISFPINIITLGLFTIVINGFMIYVVDYFLTTFTVDNFKYCIYFGLIIGLFNLIFSIFDRD